MEKNNVFSIVRYLSLQELTISEMEHLKDLFGIKSKQIDEEIRKRKYQDQK